MNLAWQLARRFRQARQKNGYISFISFSSTFGVGLGCFVLITLLSVMNGFERELINRVLAVIPHGELYSVDSQGIRDWPTAIDSIEQDPRVAAVEPYTKITGMIQQKEHLKPVELTGLNTKQASHDQWLQQVSQADWQRFTGDEKSVLLGKGLIKKLALEIGDKITVLVPTASSDLTFKAPRLMKLTLVGSLSIGGELDNHLGMMHLELASEYAGIESGAQGLRLTFHDPYQAASIIREIGYLFPQSVYMSSWTRTQGHLYSDIQLVRTVVYIVLVLVIAVACFNIVSTLVMSVREKRPAIAILKTMGASDALIGRTFIYQGLVNGTIGIVCGTLLAILIAPNLSGIVSSIESILNVEILSGDIYFIDFLPSQLSWTEVITTVAVAFVLVIISTLYPARKAAKVAPASALNG